jgi:hypothetical protein
MLFLEVGKRQGVVWWSRGDFPRQARDKLPPCLHEKFGGAGGIRTPYLRDANAAFSRVNYGPKANVKIITYLGSFATFLATLQLCCYT